MDVNYSLSHGCLQSIVLGEESVQKIMQIRLGDMLKKRVRSWRKQGFIEESKVYGAINALELSVNPKYEGFVKAVLYPLAGNVLEENNFVKKEGIWYYQNPSLLLIDS